MLHIPGLYLSENKKGRGVFTSHKLNKGDLIEICPIIKIPNGQIENINDTIFYDFYFLWKEKGFEACVALGYGSLYNHSCHPNALVILDYSDHTIKIESISATLPGSEILIDYKGGTKGENELWFDPI